MKISLIIPAYNSSPYIKKCLESCINQNGNSSIDYEIIIINDGSTDDTVSVAKSTIGQFENCSLYSKANGGLSSARNFGLHKATGDYIWFIDSDDWIRCDSLEIISNVILRCNPDVLMINAANVVDNSISKPRLHFRKGNELVKGKDIFLTNKWNACAPFYVYSKFFLSKHNLAFYEGIFHEDNEFTPRVLFFADTVIQVNEVLYFVRQTPGSITRSVNPKRAFDILTVADRLNNFSKKNIFEKHVAVRMSKYISMCLNSALLQSLDFDKKTTDRFLESDLLNDCILENFRKSNEARYMIEYLMFKLLGNPLRGYRWLRKITR